MADSTATNTVTLTVDMPDWGAKTAVFNLVEELAIADNGEQILQKIYTLTLDANGVGSQVLPVYDVAGTASWEWRLDAPDSTRHQFVLDGDPASQSLGTILAAGATSTAPDVIAGLIANKADKIIPATIGNIAGLDATGNLTDAGFVATWNDTDKTVDIPLNDNVTLQTGQELLIYARNNTGSTITNGDIVRLNGTTGTRVTITLAQADTHDNAQQVGMATEDIANNSAGFVAVVALVRGQDTNSFTEGDQLYLSAITPGLKTNVKPTWPAISIEVGLVQRKHPSDGVIFVNAYETGAGAWEKATDAQAAAEQRAMRGAMSLFPYASVFSAVAWNGGGAKTDGTNNTQNSKMRYQVDFLCSDLRLMFANSYNSEIATANSITLTVAIETSGGDFFPVFFNGQRSIDIDGGAYVITDPISIDMTAGDVFYTRTFITVNNVADDWPQQRFRVFNNGELTERGVDLSDLTLGGVISGSAVAGYGPIAIGCTLPSSLTQVMIVGDSIPYGQGDTSDDDWGFAQRALTGTKPFINLASPGELADSFAGSGKAIRGAIALSSNYAICEHGINDLIAGETAAAVQASMQAIWDSLDAAGVSVYQCTITPKTSSTDGWITTVNQTPNLPSEADRVTVNDWIRTTPPPLAGYIETANTVESAESSGLWAAPGYTSDGTHPTSTGHAAMSDAIDTSMFV